MFTYPHIFPSSHSLILTFSHPHIVLSSLILTFSHPCVFSPSHVLAGSDGGTSRLPFAGGRTKRPGAPEVDPELVEVHPSALPGIQRPPLDQCSPQLHDLRHPVHTEQQPSWR